MTRIGDVLQGGFDVKSEYVYYWASSIPSSLSSDAVSHLFARCRLTSPLPAVFAVFCLLVGAAAADEQVNLLPELSTRSLEVLDLEGIGGVTLTHVRDDPEMGPVWRIATDRPLRQPFGIGALVRTVRDVPAGHGLHLRFMVRGEPSHLDPDAAVFDIGVGTPEGYWARRTKRFHVRAGDAWQRIEIGMNSRRDEPAGELAVLFATGQTPVTLEIADVQLVDCGPDVNGYEDLPYARLTYAGREPGAPWRAEAERRIEALRQGNLTVRVIDAEGRPVVGATVEAEMTRHAFGFGTAIKEQHVSAYAEPERFGMQGAMTRENLDRYIAELRRLFSMAVTENGLKWQRWEDPKHHYRTMSALRWLDDEGFQIRGHTFYWGHWRWMPKDAHALDGNIDALRRRVTGHILTTSTATGPYLDHLDLVNEPFTWHKITDRIGEDTVAAWFRLAHEASPQTRLYLNENDVLAAGGKADHLERMARDLIAMGAPLHGIGFQAHFHWAPTPPELMLKTFDRFGALGVKLAVTEADFAGPDEGLFADQFRDLLIASFSHPDVEAFLIWGFWDGAHYSNYAPIYHKDWSIKPTGRVWMDLVMDRWWTRASGATSVDGVFATRGFLGDYLVRVTHDGDTVEQAIKLTKPGTDVTVVLEPARGEALR